MTRILYFSDIHIEFRSRRMTSARAWTPAYPLQLGPDVSRLVNDVDLAILAGDIGLGDTSDLSALLYAEQLSTFLECPVVLVPGNHEYYGTEFPTTRRALLSANRQGVMILDRGSRSFDYPEGAVRVMAATLWTDYKLFDDKDSAMAIAYHRMNDHRLITMEGGRPFLPFDAAEEHEISRAWLAERLEEPFAGKTVIVTHHVPHPTVANPMFAATDPLSPAFQSDCSQLLDAAAATGASAWIFGHHHACIDANHRGVRLLSAQWGYPGEETGWRGPAILSL